MILKIKFQTPILEINNRIKILQYLALRREYLVATPTKDIGALWTMAQKEVDLAVDHLRTVEEEAPHG